MSASTGKVTAPINIPTPAYTCQSHAGNPVAGSQFRALPTIFAINTPIIPPLNVPATSVRQPTHPYLVTFDPPADELSSGISMPQGDGPQ